jgi:hypothetical protein
MEAQYIGWILLSMERKARSSRNHRIVKRNTTGQEENKSMIRNQGKQSTQGEKPVKEMKS